ncbi:MAG TPA: hypothetical protein VLR50_15915 [Desulfobacterales bacterium]|nr:hypothetical protein [Desulfobacterales bacterium]
MIRKIAIAVLCLACFGAGFRADVSVSANGFQRAYLAQKAGSPPRTGQAPADASSVPSPGKAQGDKTQEEKPAAPPKGDPLKPFEPAEKVKADQAIDFPADI